MKRLFIAATLMLASAASAQTPKDPSARLRQVLPAKVADHVLATIADARSHSLPAKALEQQALRLANKGTKPAEVEKSIDESAEPVMNATREEVAIFDARPIAYAARHDVGRFLTEELERRQALGYPPFSHLVRIVVAGPELPPVLRALEELKAGIRGAELLGPAALLRLRGRHRAQLVAKTKQPRRIASQAARLLAAAAPAMRRARLTAVVDVDPQSL